MTHNDYQILNSFLLISLIGAGAVILAIVMAGSFSDWLDKRKTKKHFEKNNK